MNNITDFEIVNGVLKKYKGTDPNVIIPEGVTSIGEHAFFNCSSLTSVTIPTGVTTIEKSAFWGCSSLTSAIIPEGATKIGKRAFWGCSSLASITIPNSVASIESWAFYGCKSLTINCEAEKKPDGWGEDWNPNNRPVNWGYKPTKPSLDFEITNGVLIKYKGTDPNVVIPKDVTEIGYSAFYGCSSLKNITIPNGVTTIGEYAFAGCSSLENITIPNSITTIQYCAFLNCTSLASVEIPNRVTTIGHSTFYGCSSLKSITIPNSVTSIGAEAFSGCSSLTRIIIPKGVTKIEHYAFSFCPSLTINCEASEKPSGWSEDWNPSKRPVSWGYNLTEQEKKGEEEKEYKEVGNVKPSPIENFKITSNGVLTKYLGAEEIITIPEGVRSISTFAFTENYKLRGIVKQIILPKSLEIIEDGAFADLELMEKIIIPKGVGVIGRVAFRGCKSLTIYCEVNEPPKGWDTRKYSLWSADCPVVWGYKLK